MNFWSIRYEPCLWWFVVIDLYIDHIYTIYILMTWVWSFSTSFCACFDTIPDGLERQRHQPLEEPQAIRWDGCPSSNLVGTSHISEDCGGYPLMIHKKIIFAINIEILAESSNSMDHGSHRYVKVWESKSSSKLGKLFNIGVWWVNPDTGQFRPPLSRVDHWVL